MALNVSRNLTRAKLVTTLAFTLLFAYGCSKNGSQEAADAFSQGQGQTEAAMPAGHPDISATPPGEGTAASSVAGLAWSVPQDWQTGAERPMRAATYLVSAAEGDAAGAECAVFYFGSGQGGDVQSNVERWIGQFEQPDGSPSSKAAKSGELEVNGMKITTVEVAGTYTASMGPMSGMKSNNENYRLLGAIVDGPQGAVFFKLTGPSATVAKAHDPFMAMLQSMHKE